MVDLRRETAENGPFVRGFGPEGWLIGDRRVPGGVILTPDNAYDWPVDTVADLTLASLDRALKLDPPPEFLLLGSGASLVRPDPRFVAELDARGIGLEVMDSRAAARAWGVLRVEERWISAALMPL